MNNASQFWLRLVCRASFKKVSSYFVHGFWTQACSDDIGDRLGGLNISYLNFLALVTFGVLAFSRESSVSIQNAEKERLVRSYVLDEDDLLKTNTGADPPYILRFS